MKETAVAGVHDGVRFGPRELRSTHGTSNGGHDCHDVTRRVSIGREAVHGDYGSKLVAPRLLSGLTQTLDISATCLVNRFSLFCSRLGSRRVQERCGRVFLGPARRPCSRRLPSRISCSGLVTDLLGVCDVRPSYCFSVADTTGLIFERHLRSSVCQILRSCFPSCPPLSCFRVVRVPGPALCSVLRVVASPRRRVNWQSECFVLGRSGWWARRRVWEGSSVDSGMVQCSGVVSLRAHRDVTGECREIAQTVGRRF